MSQNSSLPNVKGEIEDVQEVSFHICELGKIYALSSFRSCNIFYTIFIGYLSTSFKWKNTL